MTERKPYDRLGEDGFLAERMTFYAALYPKLREAAYQQGYALALHGSLVKDLDLLAVPWTEEAAPMEELVKAIVERAGAMIPPDPRMVGEKPHGRVAFTIFLGAKGGYIDLSVMPRKEADDVE